MPRFIIWPSVITAGFFNRLQAAEGELAGCPISNPSLEQGLPETLSFDWKYLTAAYDPFRWGFREYGLPNRAGKLMIEGSPPDRISIYERQQRALQARHSQRMNIHFPSWPRLNLGQAAA